MRGPVPKRSDQRRRRNPTWVGTANGVTEVEAPERPPLRGAGSGVAAWREYAERLGYTLPAKATRTEIVAIVDAGPPSAESEWHPLAREWFDSLGESGQSAFYQPSDWATARVLAELLSAALYSRKITAALIERWQVGATELLTTEGARRRMRLELEFAGRGDDGEEASGNVAWIDEARRRLRDSG